MADLLVATTTLENKKGEKVNASEALKGKVVALYVRLALSLSNRTSCHLRCTCASGVGIALLRAS